ncbi:MAG: UPF0104 family protein [Methanothermobacter sp.]|nr:UPF0104 family protein [Methanothermobacter sp.]
MKHKGLLLLLAGVAIIGLMIYLIGPADIAKDLKRANPYYLLLAVIIQFITFALFTLRWSITTRAVGINVGKRHLLPMLLVGMAINNLTPSARGGGEPVRAYILGKYSRTSIESALATVIADRGLDTFPFIVLAIITIVSMILYFNLSPIWIISLIVAVILIIVVFFLALYVSVDDGAGEKFANWTINTLKFFYKKGYEKWSLKIKNAIIEFQDSMRVMLKKKQVFIYGIPLSFLLWLLEILRVYLIFCAFGANVTIIVIAEVFIVATLIGMIPLLPGGLGAIEGMMIILYSVAGISPSISAAVTVVERLISFWMTSILGVACLPYFGAPVVKKLSEKL